MIDLIKIDTIEIANENKAKWLKIANLEICLNNDRGKYKANTKSSISNNQLSVNLK